METSILMARIACLVYLTAAVGGFLSADFYRRIVDDLYKNSALTYMTGFTALVLGLLMVNFHNVWVGDWRVLITAIGWIAVLKGIAIMAFPEAMRRITEPFVSKAGLRLFPFMALLLGLLFGWFGFLG